MKETHGNWTALFSRTILSRGKSYYQSGKAKKLIEENDGFSLTVRGSRNYTVHIGTDYFGDLESLSCTCPYAAEGEYCKHMAAALYYLENYFGEPFCLNEEAESRLFSSKSTVSTLAGEHQKTQSPGHLRRHRPLHRKKKAEQDLWASVPL